MAKGKRQYLEILFQAYLEDNYKKDVDSIKPGTAGWLDQVNWVGTAISALAEMQNSPRGGEFLFRLHFVHSFPGAALSTFLSAVVLSTIQQYSPSQGRIPPCMTTVKARHF